MFAALRTLQGERKAAYQKAVDQAVEFTKYAIARDQDYEPGDDFKLASALGGFVFSEPEMLRIIGRQIRYEQARYFAETGKDRQPRPDSDPEIDMAA